MMANLRELAFMFTKLAVDRFIDVQIDSTRNAVINCVMSLHGIFICYNEQWFIEKPFIK